MGERKQYKMNTCTHSDSATHRCLLVEERVGNIQGPLVIVGVIRSPLVPVPDAFRQQPRVV